jgi:hypothetical protein
MPYWKLESVEYKVNQSKSDGKTDSISNVAIVYEEEISAGLVKMQTGEYSEGVSRKERLREILADIAEVVGNR